MEQMGIADNVLALAHNVGLALLFQANHFAYKNLSLEFLSTVEVRKTNGVPMEINFQLRDEWHMLTADNLNQILGGRRNGAYLGNHSFNTTELWNKIAPKDDGTIEYFTASASMKASAIRNPALRYFHRLISTGLLSRMDDGTFQANELHLLWAALNHVPQNLGCYLMEHFHTQARASSKIAIGGMITPIARHLGISITEQPVSTEILLNRRALTQRSMLNHTSNPRSWPWVIIRSDGKYTFPLPQTELTNVFGEDALPRWRMDTPQHVGMMRRLPARSRARGGPIDVDMDERVEEEEQYDQGVGHQQQEPPVQEPFHMRAPDFEGFEQRFYSHTDEHHNAQMAAHDNYYMMQRQYMDEQFGAVNANIAGLRSEVQDVHSTQLAMMDIINRMSGSWPYYPSQDPPPMD